MQTKPTRILQIVSSLSTGSGVLSVVLNWHRHIDTTQIQFDYLYYKRVSTNRQQEIEQLGGQCYELPNPTSHPLQFLRESYKFFKTRRYNTVHSHITHLNLFFFPLAKVFGAQNIIQHAHATKWGFSGISNVRNCIMLHAVWPLITHKMACSKLAGKIYYGKNFTIINNGIDVKKFAYNSVVRARKRKELSLEDNFIVGQVGRFSVEKNHAFLLDVFAELVKMEPVSRLVLVGEGYLEEKIKNQVKMRGLEDKVLFLGIRKDVAELYDAFDVLCMPSLHEGFPVVGAEAQCSGLPVVFSDTITSEVLLLPDSFMLSLKDAPAKWAAQILLLKGKQRKYGDEFLLSKGLDIRQTARQIQDFYLELKK